MTTKKRKEWIRMQRLAERWIFPRDTRRKSRLYRDDDIESKSMYSLSWLGRINYSWRIQLNPAVPPQRQRSNSSALHFAVHGAGFCGTGRVKEGKGWQCLSRDRGWEERERGLKNMILIPLLSEVAVYHAFVRLLLSLRRTQTLSKPLSSTSNPKTPLSPLWPNWHPRGLEEGMGKRGRCKIFI